MNPISVETHLGVVTVDTDQNTTAEDVIIEVCKHFKIGPVARHLFALRLKSTQVWLGLHIRMEEIPIKDLEFKIRFNVPDVSKLEDIDSNAYNFYFSQVRHGVLYNTIPGLDYNKFRKEINGLCVVDMCRAIVELGLKKEDVVRDYKKYIPKEVKRRHWIFVKKPLANTLDTIKMNFDAGFAKSGYLEQFNKIVPDYLSEDFNALINNVDRLDVVVLRVNPFNSTFPGVSIKYEHKDEWEHLCKIDELCYLNTRSEGTVEFSRKNGIPLYLHFHSLPDMMSFVSFLDGYYRLTVKWIFNLSRDSITPSLQRLASLRCHGPVSGEFSYHKLEEKRNNQVGCFILRESNLAYDTYYIDVCTKNSSKPVTYKIEMTNDKQYRLSNHETTYPSVQQLIADYRTEDKEFVLKECLPPSEYDQSNLLICQTEEAANKLNRSQEALPMSKPIFVDPRAITAFKGMPHEGRCPYTVVYRGYWSVGKERRVVSMKILRETFKEKYISEFLSLSNRWAFVNSNAVVKFYGLTLSSPVSMVSEYLPYGPLDVYLAEAERGRTIKEVDLVEAATHLANALWSMEETGFVHGNIRCRKLMVCFHTDNKFVVKLADPGLHHEFVETDLHWIPPEHYNDPSKSRSSIMTDVWAYGTTLWQIFSYGKTPPEVNGDAIKNHILSGQTLPQPAGCPSNIYEMMKECWLIDPFSRKKPQPIMRDINQILYQVYNARQGHTYAAIIPTHDFQHDNISNESDELSSSLFSELTMNTFLDENSGGNLSSGLQLYPNLNQLSSPTYRRYTTDPVSVMPMFKQQEYSITDTAISSLQSVFELDQEFKLVLTGRIGEGFYGEVYKGMLHHWHNEEETQKVAVKKLKPHAITRDKHDDFEREISIMKKLEHPNIVQIKGIVRDPELSLVLEYIEFGSLRSYLNIHRDQLTTHHLLKFALDVAQGMAYLSDKKIVHRDLATRNILVVNEGMVKISDFGLAHFIGNKEYYLFKTERDLPLQWYAPESLEFGKFSPQSDVWSYGVTLFEMFSYGEDPRLPMPLPPTSDNLSRALKSEIRLPCPTKCPYPVYFDIMRVCWKYEAKDRPTFHQLSVMIQNLFKPTDDPAYEAMHNNLTN